MQSSRENRQFGAGQESIRICGTTESLDENLYDVLLSFINDKLSIQCGKSDIDTAYRIGVRQQNGKSGPRTIIVKFNRSVKRNEVYAAKKLLKGSPYSLYEDLTGKRFELLTLAKKKFGSNKAWSYGGNIFYWNSTENRKVKINDKSQL